MKQRSKRISSQPYAGTQAVLRAIALLKSFTDQNPVQPLSRLAHNAKLNKTTTYRLLTALESEGFIARDPISESYMLGSEMIVLGGQALRSNNLRSLSHAELQVLAQVTRESSSLEILMGREVLILDEVLGGHLMSGNQSIGTRWPAYATSTGKAILAYSPREKQETFLAGPFPKITERTITDAATLQREFTAIRKRGYAIADEAIELGYIAIGAPVLNHEEEAVAAVCIGGPRIRIVPAKIPQIGAQVRASADRISSRLGYRGLR